MPSLFARLGAFLVPVAICFVVRLTYFGSTIGKILAWMRPQKITRGEMRESRGRARGLQRRANYRCRHSVALGADRWPDDLWLSDIGPRFVCSACGRRGA